MFPCRPSVDGEDGRLAFVFLGGFWLRLSPVATVLLPTKPWFGAFTYKLFQVSSLDEGLDLILEVTTAGRVVPVIPVELTILALVFLGVVSPGAIRPL